MNFFTILCILMVILGIFGLIGMFVKTNKSGKDELIDEMFKNGDIDEKTYKKYKYKD